MRYKTISISSSKYGKIEQFFLPQTLLIPVCDRTKKDLTETHVSIRSEMLFDYERGKQLRVSQDLSRTNLYIAGKMIELAELCHCSATALCYA